MGNRQCIEDSSLLVSSIWNNSDLIIFETAVDGTVTSINSAGERALGYSASELVNRQSCIAFLEKEELSKRTTAISAELNEPVGTGFSILSAKALRQVSHSCEWTFVRKDGSHFAVSVNLTPVRDHTDKLLGFLAIALDLSRQAEAEKRLSLAATTAKVGIWEWDIASNVLNWDDNMYEMYGINRVPGNNTYATWAESLDPAIRSSIEEELQQAIRGEKPFDTFFTICRLSGDVRHIRATGLVERDRDGKARRMIGTNLDVTDQIVSKERLAAQTAELRDIKLAVDQHSIVAITDVRGKITYVNDKFCEISRYSREELLGQDHRIINSGFHSKEFIRDLWRTIAQGNVWKGEIKNRAKDGSYYWVATTIVPFLNAEGKPYQYVAIRTDISDRKAQEQEILEKAEDLKRSNLELEQFAYVASHDLQEPLRMVGSFAELLGQRYKDQFDDKGREWLNYLVDGAIRMRVLVQDLLAYSRVGKYELSVSAVDITAVVQAVLLDLKASITDSKAKIEIGALPRCLGDRGQIQLLFQNLIANAIKFHLPDVPPRIQISSKVHGSEVTYSVKDNGIGIDAEYFERIFVIFQRLHGKFDYPGTGLGLAICKKIIERHRGRIWIESEKGEGATFSFTLKKA